jgi:hypothetical protein
MKPLRSLLFVPGNKAAWMEKAPQYGADALILDLEDSVPHPDKATARTLVRQAIETLSARGQTLYVRVNALETNMTGDDLNAIVGAGLRGLLPPKVETADDVSQLDTLLAYFEHREGLTPGSIELIPTLETAKGIRNAYEIALPRRAWHPSPVAQARGATLTARWAIAGREKGLRPCSSARKSCSMLVQPGFNIPWWRVGLMSGTVTGSSMMPSAIGNWGLAACY